MCTISFIFSVCATVMYISIHLSEGITVDAAWFRSGAALYIASYLIFSRELREHLED